MVYSLSPKTRYVVLHIHERDIADRSGTQQFPRGAGWEAEGDGVGRIVRAHERL